MIGMFNSHIYKQRWTWLS